MKPIYLLIALFTSLQATAQSPWTKEKGQFLPTYLILLFLIIQNYLAIQILMCQAQ